MDNMQKTRTRVLPWHWILPGLAILLTAIWLYLTPEGILGKANAIGYSVCHQIDARSFQFGDQKMPLCARCTGLFLGALLGVVYQLFRGRKGKMPSLPLMILLGLFAFAWVFDGINSFLMLHPTIPSLYETSNITRLITGTGMGLAIAGILVPIFNQTMYQEWEDISPLNNLGFVSGYLGAAMILDVLILLEIPWILFLLSLLSALGVLILLTMVYSLVWVMIFKRENTYTGLQSLMMPLLGGYCVAILQIGAFDLVRFLMTGTWDGFGLF
jgi:uncharacterized membrane protein